MRRMSDEAFVNQQPDPDHVVGLRVKNGEFFFLAWMEDAPHYKIQQAMSSDGYLLSRDFIVDGDIFSSIQATKEYNFMYLHWCTDDEDNLVDSDKDQFCNAHEKFLSLLNCYERNGVSDVCDHDIFVLTKDELSSISDALRDGDYVFILNE